MVRKRAAPVTDAKGAVEVKLLTQRRQATWPGAESVKWRIESKKNRDNVVVPFDAGEN